MMTDKDFIAALADRGIKAEVIDGVVMMFVSEKEMSKYRKYQKIVAEIGWKRSWGRMVSGE